MSLTGPNDGEITRKLPGPPHLHGQFGTVASPESRFFEVSTRLRPDM